MEKALLKLPQATTKILEKLYVRLVVDRLPSVLSIADATYLLSLKESTSLHALAMIADQTRALRNGEGVTYVTNRNINFTNACIKKCGFCAFSRTGIDDEAYFLPMQEIIARAKQAYNEYNASEVCIQAGLPPRMDPSLYESIAREVKTALPNVYLHAYSPEELQYGAQLNNVSISTIIARLQEAGVDSFPGTSAEILVDSVRRKLARELSRPRTVKLKQIHLRTNAIQKLIIRT